MLRRARTALALLATLPAALLQAAPLAETLEMRVFSVATGLDPGDGSGTPPSDYYLDGGAADGLAAGMRLPVFRSHRIHDALRDRDHAIRVRVGELELLRVFDETAVARVSRIETAAEAPLLEPRAVMIGDYVSARRQAASGGAALPADVPTPGPGGFDGGWVPDAATAANGGSVSRPGSGGPVPSAGPAGAIDGADAPSWSLPAAPEAFLPGFPSANTWYPLPPPVLFGLNSSDLDQPAQLDLEGIALMLRRNPERRLALEGRTCDLGSERYNQALSLRRAQTVAAFLQSLGVDAERFSLTALGESAPLGHNTSEADRSRNRRVDLSLGSVGPTPEPEIPGTLP